MGSFSYEYETGGARFRAWIQTEEAEPENGLYGDEYVEEVACIGIRTKAGLMDFDFKNAAQREAANALAALEWEHIEDHKSNYAKKLLRDALAAAKNEYDGPEPDELRSQSAGLFEALGECLRMVA